MIEYSPAVTIPPSLLKTIVGAIAPVEWQTLNSDPIKIIAPTGTSYIFPVAFYYMLSGSSVGGTLPLYLNTPYQASNLTGAMQSTAIAPGNVSGVYSMYPAFSSIADFYYPETSSGFFDPNMNYLQLWQTADEPTVIIGNKVPYVLYYYEVGYANFEPI